MSKYFGNKVYGHVYSSGYEGHTDIDSPETKIEDLSFLQSSPIDYFVYQSMAKVHPIEIVRQRIICDLQFTPEESLPPVEEFLQFLYTHRNQSVPPHILHGIFVLVESKQQTKLRQTITNQSAGLFAALDIPVPPPFLSHENIHDTYIPDSTTKPPAPPTLPVPSSSELMKKSRTRAAIAPRSPLVRILGDINSKTIAQNVKHRKAQLEQFEYATDNQLFFAFSDSAHLLESMDSCENIFLSPTESSELVHSREIEGEDFIPPSPSSLHSPFPSSTFHPTIPNECNLKSNYDATDNKQQESNFFGLNLPCSYEESTFPAGDPIGNSSNSPPIQSAYQEDVTLQDNSAFFPPSQPFTFPAIIPHDHSNTPPFQTNSNAPQFNFSNPAPLPSFTSLSSFVPPTTFQNTTNIAYQEDVTAEYHIQQAQTPFQNKVTSVAYQDDVTESNLPINPLDTAPHILGFTPQVFPGVAYEEDVVASPAQNESAKTTNLAGSYEPSMEMNNNESGMTFTERDFSFASKEPPSPTPVPSIFSTLQAFSTQFSKLERMLDGIHDLSTLKQIISTTAAQGDASFTVEALIKNLHIEKSLLDPHHRDWNKEYQTLLEIPTDTVEKYRSLAKLAHDFVYAATTYAKIIISEQCIPNNKKTIPPVSVGGVAGGQKYLCQNIMFKFALDVEIPGGYMYGGQYIDHESAMKAAAHELKGLCQYYSTLTPGLSYPLLANIDYKGFRMIAISVLPIGEDSLCYGSEDSGLTVVAKDPLLNRKMRAAGDKLNLREHISGISRDKCSVISSCGDLEVHKGTDGRFYILDFARSFPPEAPPPQKDRPRAVYYRLLRPELVRMSKEALSSDAFTAWGSLDPNYKIYNYHVSQITKKLLQELIPAFAARLESDYAGIENKLIPEIHREGINVRHLGQIRYHTTSDAVRSLLLTEMIVRVVKNQLRDLMRATMRQTQGLSQEPFKAVVIKVFNLVLGRDVSQCKPFWKTVQRQLKLKFWNGITKTSGLTMVEETDFERIQIVNMVSMKRLFRRLLDLLGVRITDQAIRQLDDDTGSFEFVDADIIEVYAQPRFMDIIDFSQAMAAEKMAREKTSDRERLRLLELSGSKFAKALHSTPANHLALYHWGAVLFQQAKFTTCLYERNEFLKDAATKFHSALKIEPSFCPALVHGAELYLTLAMNDSQNSERYFKECASLFNNAITLAPKYKGLFHRYLDEIMALPNRTFQLRGLLLLCAGSSTLLPCTKTLEIWCTVIMELVIHSPSFSREKLAASVTNFMQAGAELLLYDESESSLTFFVSTINRVTEMAFYHKVLFLFVAELYHLIQSTEENTIQLYKQWGFALLEYSGTVDYLQYTEILQQAAQQLEKAVQLAPSCLDETMKNVIDEQNISFVRWLRIIESSEVLRERFAVVFSRLNRFELEFTWCNLSLRSAEFLASLMKEKLVHLSFMHNYEVGRILEPFYRLCPRLQSLSISLCTLTSEDIKNLCMACPTLTDITLDDCNGFSSEVLIWISSLPKLRSVVLKGIKWLKGTAKFLVARSSTIEVLSINDASIPDSELVFLANFTKLTSVSFSNCKFAEKNVPLVLQKANCVRELDISKTFRDTDCILQMALPSPLTSVNISNCKKMTDKGLQVVAEAMQKSSTLISLNLSDCCRITDGGLFSLSHARSLRNLEELNLSFNVHIQESSIASILQSLDGSRLRCLSLARCKLNNRTLSYLKSNTNSLNCLQELSIAYTAVSDLQQFLTSCPYLEKIDVRACPITNDSVSLLVKCCPSITDVDLSKCNGITEDVIIHLIEKAKAIMHLRLNENLLVSSKTIIAISDHCRLLQTLELCNNVKMLDSDISHLQNLTQLRSLILNGCIRVKSSSLVKIVQASMFLRKLNVDSTKLIDNRGVIEIVKFAKNLHEFSARNCTNITSESRDWIRQYRPEICFLSVANSDFVGELTGHRQFLSGRIKTHRFRK